MFTLIERGIVVLANDRDAAVAHGMKVRPDSSYEIIAMTGREHLYDLYGQRNLFFDIAPGTVVQPWHDGIWVHVEYQRLIPMRNFRKRAQSNG